MGCLKMKFSRVSGGSGSLDTHEVSAYAKAIRRAIRLMENDQFIKYEPWAIIDPFARNHRIGTHRNDIDPSTNAEHHMDAAEFMELCADADVRAKLILLDPPFSGRQSSRYEAGDTCLYAAGDGRMGRIGDTIPRMLIPNGRVIKIGYNSNSPCQTGVLELTHCDLVTFGGLRNDWIITTWRRSNYSLYQFPMETEGRGSE
tara:strand:+ start:377 stop:979 length:603 start_codon:yes stop_codon:yes gene_type:complete